MTHRLNPTLHTCHTCGYVWKTGRHGGHSCSVLLLERIKKLEEGDAKMIAALTRIEKWIGEFPEVGMRDGKIGSYGYAYGSNGERDYMRAVARKALEGIDG